MEADLRSELVRRLRAAGCVFAEEEAQLLLDADAKRAGERLEALVRETLDRVEQHMPEVDLTAARRRLGWRQIPWQPSSPESGEAH